MSVKKYIPASRETIDNYYKELKKENAELKKMILDLQEMLVGNRRELHDTHLDTQKIRAEVHSVFENTKNVREELHDVHKELHDVHTNGQKIREELHDEHQKVIAIKQDVYNSRKKTSDLLKYYEQVEKGRLSCIEQVLLNNAYGVTKEKRDTQVVVSLTSYQNRIATLPIVLERLLNQTVKPDHIVLYLAKENFPMKEKELPERLLLMQSRGLEIRWCEKDIKSYKKVIPALQDYPNDIIITVDDDIYYDLDLVEKLYDSYKRFPEAISATRAHRMLINDEGALLPYNEWIKEDSEYIKVPRMDLFATTGAGTLFPPSSLDREVMNEERFMELCPNADDVWMKFMAVMNDTPVVVVDVFNGLKYISGTQEESLWNINISENDIQIQRLLEVYNKFQKNKKPLMERVFNEAD